MGSPLRIPLRMANRGLLRILLLRVAKGESPLRIPLQMANRGPLRVLLLRVSNRGESPLRIPLQIPNRGPMRVSLRVARGESPLRESPPRESNRGPLRV